LSKAIAPAPKQHQPFPVSLMGIPVSLMGTYTLDLPLPALQVTRELLIGQRSILDLTIGKFEGAINSAVAGGSTNTPPADPALTPPEPTKSGRKPMTQAGRGRLAAAQKKRWADKKAADAKAEAAAKRKPRAKKAPLTHEATA
jgi:hypothetical protein